MRRFRGFSIVLIIVVQLQMVLHADELSRKTIDAQITDQQSCINNKLPQCETKCKAAEGTNVHCNGLCKLNITNECRYAGE